MLVVLGAVDVHACRCLQDAVTYLSVAVDVHVCLYLCLGRPRLLPRNGTGKHGMCVVQSAGGTNPRHAPAVVDLGGVATANVCGARTRCVEPDPAHSHDPQYYSGVAYVAYVGATLWSCLSLGTGNRGNTVFVSTRSKHAFLDACAWA